MIISGCQYKRSTYAIGVLAFTWSIVAFVIVNAYNSSVISYLSINYKKPEVSTFKELANNDNFNVLTLKGTVLEIDIKVIDIDEIYSTLRSLVRFAVELFK